MKKTVLLLIIVILVAISGFSPTDINATDFFKTAASLYAPAENVIGAGVMRFGSELSNEIPDRNYLK